MVPAVVFTFFAQLVTLPESRQQPVLAVYILWLQVIEKTVFK
jgi:hypothetical protein